MFLVFFFPSSTEKQFLHPALARGESHVPRSMVNRRSVSTRYLPEPLLCGSCVRIVCTLPVTKYLSLCKPHQHFDITDFVKTLEPIASFWPLMVGTLPTIRQWLDPKTCCRQRRGTEYTIMTTLTRLLEQTRELSGPPTMLLALWSKHCYDNQMMTKLAATSIGLVYTPSASQIGTEYSDQCGTAS